MGLEWLWSQLLCIGKSTKVSVHHLSHSCLFFISKFGFSFSLLLTAFCYAKLWPYRRCVLLSFHHDGNSFISFAVTQQMPKVNVQIIHRSICSKLFYSVLNQPAQNILRIQTTVTRTQMSTNLLQMLFLEQSRKQQKSIISEECIE